MFLMHRKSAQHRLLHTLSWTQKWEREKMTKFFTHGQVSDNVIPTCCLWFCCWLKQTKRKMFLDCLCNWKLTIPCRSPPLGRPSWNETIIERNEMLILWFWQLFLFTHTKSNVTQKHSRSDAPNVHHFECNISIIHILHIINYVLHDTLCARH